MRAFIPPTLPIILLSLLSADKIFAIFSADAFGTTNYGFKCADRIYKKYEIFAAAKKLCDVRAVNPVSKFGSYIDFSLPWIQEMLCPVDRPRDTPFAKIPLLKDGTLYPLELVPGERYVKDSDGAIVKKLPGPDHLIIDNKCGIVGAYIDHGDENEQGVRYVTCTLLKNAKDIARPSEGQSNFCDYPPTRSPQGSP
ncbi:hypothetical protein EPUL_003363 [Erysiphe pulchra]|uniref:Uncharacterized protein n=1 Tax=Erysiphe pulchra TaxID=225359 RepID=A0A2S4PSR8_9PEZI|nr:hypothetical protein EPUL_003363 [Erysiphe pulchra]